MLRRQLDEDGYINPDLDEDDESPELEADRERLEELQEILEEECDVDVSADDEDDDEDLDLPEYAAESPSEPRDFEVK
jgi:hypothetical protein